MTKQPENNSLKDFLEKSIGTQFVIPVFQRNYIWKANKQVKKLMEDLFEIVDNKKKSHFIGIVIKKSSNIKLGLYEDLIIDGQQRIITIFLLTQAIRKIAKETNQDIMVQLCDKILINDMYKNDDDYKHRLKPLIDDNDVYRKIAEEDYASITDAEKKTNIYQNFCFIEKMLLLKYHQEDFADIYNALGGMYMVTITLDESDNSQEIFETLNSTGAALSKADLIRNFLLMQYKDTKKQEKAYLTYWKPLQDLFPDSNKLELFLRNFLAAKTFDLPDLEDVYDVFKKWYYDKVHTYTSVDKLITDIKDYATYYNELYISTPTIKDKNYLAIIEEFRQSTFEPAAPILIEIFALYKKNHISIDTLTKSINLFITYTTRRNICNLRTGALTRTAPGVLREVLKDCITTYDNLYSSLVLNLVNKQIGKTTFMPDDAYMRNTLKTENVYVLRNYLKPIFSKIENYKSHVIVDVSMCSIEHLMPQTPTKEWIDYLKITEQEYEFHLNRLGNLTLVGAKDNSIMGNKPFDYKKKVLNTTNHITMNKEILALTDWKVEQIDERTEKLIEKICELYKYETVTQTQQIKFAAKYTDSTNALEATIFENYSVQLNVNSLLSSPRFTQEFQKYLEDGNITQNHNKYKVNSPIEFNSLEELCVFVGIDENLCWEQWKDNNGDELSISVKVQLDNINRK